MNTKLENLIDNGLCYWKLKHEEYTKTIGGKVFPEFSCENCLGFNQECGAYTSTGDYKTILDKYLEKNEKHLKDLTD